jgi:hypothetical protein
MPFNPLGNFDATAQFDPRVVAKVRAFEATLPQPPAGHGLKRIYAHWTVSTQGCNFTDYNGEAKFVNGQHVLALTHNPLDEISGYNSSPEIAGTWHRNTASIACAITGMDGATETNYGPDPVTVAGLTYLCGIMGAFAHRYGIDVHARVAPADATAHADNNGDEVNTKGEWNLLTHGEVAVIDGYSSERWDLGSFVPLPSGLALTPAMRSQCGDALRLMTWRFMLALGEPAKH